jgi:uncharacterized OsmC-like protein
MMSQLRVFEIQIPLRQRYKAKPEAALVVDCARARGNDPDDPFHSIVMPMPQCGIAVPVGVHQAVGGLHDAPTPGDMLCAALAACQDSTVRMVANILGITLESLEVEVTGDVDVRGTLAMSAEVPVGFRAIRCAIRLKAKDGTDPRLLEKLRIASERSCVVQQTLLHPPRVETTFDITGGGTDAGSLQVASGQV